ncbi:DinB family protein [Flindersiella endophytica]
MDWRDLPLDDLRQGNEAEQLCWALERVHQQFAWKTGGLDAEQLRRQHPPSKMTLAGLIKHMASVEESWTAAAHGREPNLPWSPAVFETDVDWDWHSAVDDEPEELYALWYGVVGRTVAAWREMGEDGGLDVGIHRGEWQGQPYIVSRRRMLLDVLEENLMHTGHADMLREAVDGLRGNGPR